LRPPLLKLRGQSAHAFGIGAKFSGVGVDLGRQNRQKTLPETRERCLLRAAKAMPELGGNGSVFGCSPKEAAMKKFTLIAIVMLAGTTLATAQNAAPSETSAPANKSEAATPAPAPIQNALPDKLAPGPLDSPNAVPADSKAEQNASSPKMDSAAEKKTPGTTTGQDNVRPK
jgi:hypothetical protein